MSHRVADRRHSHDLESNDVRTTSSFSSQDARRFYAEVGSSSRRHENPTNTDGASAHRVGEDNVVRNGRSRRWTNRPSAPASLKVEGHAHRNFDGGRIGDSSSAAQIMQDGSSQADCSGITTDCEEIISVTSSQGWDDGTSRPSIRDERVVERLHGGRSQRSSHSRGRNQRTDSSVRQQWRPTVVASHKNQAPMGFFGSNLVGSINDGETSASISTTEESQMNNIDTISGGAFETSAEVVLESLQSISIQGTQGQGKDSRTVDSLRSQQRNSSKSMGRNFKLSKSNEAVRSKLQNRISSISTSNLKDRVNVPLLVQELEEKLAKGTVECMICYDRVRREAAIWSCGACYAIFHIACIKKWAKAPISSDSSIASSDRTTPGNWRCPGCQSLQFVSADEIKYNCFCGQVRDPPVDYYLTCHSCGGPCKKPLNSGRNPHCKHTCTMQCHPGPCPPCSALALPYFCPCGKTSYTERCSEVKTAKSCGKVCGHQLGCGRHYCERICHDGPCGDCSALLPVKCFCGEKKEVMLCSAMDLHGEIDWENGVFSCGNACPHNLSCGKHTCNKQCHPGDCGECELSPGKLQTCPCGKVAIQKLLGAAKRRETCTDPVPTCGGKCQKLLPCGKHVCQSQCHLHDCPACEIEVELRCRCQSTSQKMPCHKASAIESDRKSLSGEENEHKLFLCNRKCGRKKNCGRHRCNNKCCPLANGGNPLIFGEDNPHFCSLTCGKKLRCGQHLCDELCHNGHCPPCLGSTFTELSCACGKTSIPPPIPCGTFPPSCPHPCSRPQPCGHPATHQCHFGDCPPCIVLTTKECVGGHVVLRNVPCGSKDIKCNTLCGKTRQCGLHACARLCHLPPCDTPTHPPDNTIKSCGQQCRAPRRDCHHVCSAICHPGTPCPDTRCEFPVTITCSCGHLSQKVPCDAGGNTKGNASLELAYYTNLQLQPVDEKNRVPLGQRNLACDEECAKLEKKRILADAFGMTETPIEIVAENVQDASDALKELLRRDPQSVLAVEERFKYLVLGSKSAVNVGSVRVHVFKYLPREMREVIRQLADKWNLSVIAVGREPRRFLIVHVSSKTKVPPMRSLVGKSSVPLPGQAQAPVFNPSLDMDPRLVIGLFDLPRDADISALVLRFGGECELVWLNDRNALAVFSDMRRAATAIRRVDHASVYSGAVKMSHPLAESVRSWGTNEGGTSSTLSRKKSTQEPSWSEDAWGEEWGRIQANTGWDQKGPSIASVNPWGALQQVESNVAMQDVTANLLRGEAAIIQHIPNDIAAENWEDLDN